MDRDGGGENVGTIKINNLFQPECEPTGEVPPPTYTSSNEREDEEEEEEEGDEDEEEECSEGYVNSPSGECEDWDECSEGNGGCEESCINKPGTYECACPQVIVSIGLSRNRF